MAREACAALRRTPAIFKKAVAEGAGYDEDIARAAVAGRLPAGIYEELITTDVRDACDVLRPVYEETDGLDGFVSLEVSPPLAHDTEASVEEARRLWKLVDRPNLFIKIPGTPAGISAVEQLLFEGINVNITLLFSIARYEAVAEAYLRALERRLEAGLPIKRIAGGLGDGVTAAVGAIAPVHRFGVTQLPRSGPGPALLDRFGISHGAIEQRVLQLAA